MAVTADTLRLTNDLRIAINAETTAATRTLVQAWIRAWDQIYIAWLDAITDLLAASTDGRWPTRAQIARAERARRALEVSLRELERLASHAAVTITDRAGRVIEIGAGGQSRIIASQMPPAAGGMATLAVRFDRVSPEAIRAIVLRTTEQITALTRPLSSAAIEAIRQALIRGVAIGENPRVAARRMLERVEGAFNGGLTRALTIARTEMLDAYRTAAAAAHDANSDVLKGWQWQATLDARTCPSCWSKHGTVFDLDVPGPADHQQGRCARTPVTKSWRELGFAIPEPPSVMPDARQVFDALPRADQLQIMGARRLELLRAGRIGWDDLSAVRRTPGWRDSYGARPVKDLELKRAA